MMNPDESFIDDVLEVVDRYGPDADICEIATKLMHISVGLIYENSPNSSRASDYMQHCLDAFIQGMKESYGP